MNILFENSEVEKLLFSYEKPTLAKINKQLYVLSQFAQDLGMPYSRRIQKNLYELRIRGQQEVRIFYCFYQGRIFLLHGFIKKSQKIPSREIDTASSRIKRLTGI